MVGYERFKGPYCLKTVAAWTSKTSVSYHSTTRFHISQELDLKMKVL